MKRVVDSCWLVPQNLWSCLRNERNNSQKACVTEFGKTAGVVILTLEGGIVSGKTQMVLFM